MIAILTILMILATTPAFAGWSYHIYKNGQSAEQPSHNSAVYATEQECERAGNRSASNLSKIAQSFGQSTSFTSTCNQGPPASVTTNMP